MDDGAKLQILHYLSELLPDAEQQAFDRAAARMISRKMDSKQNDFFLYLNFNLFECLTSDIVLITVHIFCYIYNSCTWIISLE